MKIKVINLFRTFVSRYSGRGVMAIWLPYYDVENSVNWVYFFANKERYNYCMFSL